MSNLYGQKLQTEKVFGNHKLINLNNTTEGLHFIKVTDMDSNAYEIHKLLITNE